MKVAVLPFTTSNAADAAYGRQMAFLLGESLKSLGAEVLNIAYLARVDHEGQEHVAFVAMATELPEIALLMQVLRETEADVAIDGHVSVGERFGLTVRILRKGATEPQSIKNYDMERARGLSALTSMLFGSVGELGLTPTDDFKEIASNFGTLDIEAFLSLMHGWDALNYLNQAEGAVTPNFDPSGAMDALVDSIRRDPDFVAPYEALMGLVRQCLMRGIGEPSAMERTVRSATQLCEDDWRGWYMLGDILQRTNRAADAQAAYEKALQLNPADAAVWVRLGMMQMAQGDVVSAEGSFRAALSREGDSEQKTAAPYLSTLLFQSNRKDEAAALWAELRDKDPSEAANWTGLAAVQYQGGDPDAGIATLIEALTKATDVAQVRVRLAQLYTATEKHNKALEQFEQAVPHIPYDHGLTAEYAQCLFANGKTDELKNVLRQILSFNPPADLRAQTVAWQMEIEQPDRLKRFEEIHQKLQGEGDKTKAVEELEQLARWLGDYWKLWLVLASGYNGIEQHAKAEQAAGQLLGMFPGCEPAYGEMSAALFGQGKAEDAYKLLRRAARAYPQFLVVMANLGMAAKFTGRTDEARQIAEGLRKLDAPQLEPLIKQIEEDLG